MIVAAVGLVVFLIGWSLSAEGMTRGFILGFGAAHVLLGLLDALLDRGRMQETGNRQE